MQVRKELEAKRAKDDAAPVVLREYSPEEQAGLARQGTTRSRLDGLKITWDAALATVATVARHNPDATAPYAAKVRIKSCCACEG